jgi:hypothetical protein
MFTVIVMKEESHHFICRCEILTKLPVCNIDFTVLGMGEGCSEFFQGVSAKPSKHVESDNVTPPFLTVTLGGNEWSLSCTSCFNLSTNWLKDWLSLRAVLQAIVKCSSIL